MSKEKTTSAAPFETSPDFEADIEKALADNVAHPLAGNIVTGSAFEKGIKSEAKHRKAYENAGGFEGVVARSTQIDAGQPRIPRTSPAKRVARAERIAKVLDTREYTGGSTSYYEIDILHPHKKRKPYMAECLDIIEALGMSFAEGECFKAIWRKCAARQGKSKRGYDDAKYDAEKIAFYGQRILDDVITPKGNKS